MFPILFIILSVPSQILETPGHAGRCFLCVSSLGIDSSTRFSCQYFRIWSQTLTIAHTAPLFDFGNTQDVVNRLRPLYPFNISNTAQVLRESVGTLHSHALPTPISASLHWRNRPSSRHLTPGIIKLNHFRALRGYIFSVARRSQHIRYSLGNGRQIAVVRSGSPKGRYPFLPSVINVWCRNLL